MSGSTKDDAKAGGAARREAAAPTRGASQNLFELDAPSGSSTRPIGFLESSRPANDVQPPSAALENDPLLDSQLIDAEFAALANAGDAASPAKPLREAAPERLYETRPLTHVSENEEFDATLKLPKYSDAIEARRGRLAVRYKAVCASYKMLTAFELGAVDRKELVELFSAYESRIRAIIPSPPGGRRDADSLHSLIPPPGIDELERALAKIEERLLAVDETVDEDEFREEVSKAKHPLKALLRYARLLASKRFNVGYRRDRFEYLATELLTTPGADKRVQLLSRAKAATVLQHLLAGLPHAAPLEERPPATKHLREALDRLSAVDGPNDFFESEFILDLHGYKISMRDHITCPEFLYLCAAIEVEVHNRLLAFCRNGTPSWQTLNARLQAQRSAAEDVFPGFRRTRSQRAPKPSPQLSAAKEDKPQPAPTKRKKRRQAAVEEATSAARTAWLKFGGLGLVAVLAGASALHSAGLYSFTSAPPPIASAQLEALSPLLLKAKIDPSQRKLEALVSRPHWQRLTKSERRELAQDLAAKLKRMNVVNARVLAAKSTAIQIDFSVVVFVDETSGNPTP